MSERNRTAALRQATTVEKVAIISFVKGVGKGLYGGAQKMVTKGAKPGGLFSGSHKVLGEAGTHIGATGLLATGAGGTYLTGKKLAKDYRNVRQDIRNRSGGV